MNQTLARRLPLPRINEDNRRWWTLGAMCFALFMIMLDNTVVNVALPSIQRGLHATTSSLEWTVNAYTLTFAITLVTGGRLGDIYGRRKMFLFGVILFGTASFLIGLAQSDVWLVAFRAVQGVGSGFMMPATLSIITNTFDARERGRAIGTWAGVSAMALAIGPVVGGFLVQDVSWQSIFFLNVPVAILAVIVTLLAARESRDETAIREVDVPGVATLTVGLGALVLGLVQSNEWGWGSARVLGLFALAAAMLVAFVVVERTRRAPMVDFSFFRSRSFLGANLVAFIVSFAMFAMFFYLALYMQDVLRFTPLQAGVRFLPSTVMIMIVAPIAGRLADRIGPRPLMTIGLCLVSFSLFWMTGITTHSSYSFLIVSFVVLGIGMGLVMSPMSTAAMNSVEATKAGVASGLLSMTRMVGSTFGVAVIGAIVATLGRTHLQTLLPQVPAAERGRLVNALGSGATGGATVPTHVQTALSQTYVYALSNALYVAGGVALLGALLAWVLVARRPAPAPAHASEARPEARDAGQEANAESPATAEPLHV
ncbi:MAG TPA: MFS transporter [Solirubrobacteraceae bacterium]|nr:MFS transporter [Solirubrobacteraceae bacterium]